MWDTNTDLAVAVYEKPDDVTYLGFSYYPERTGDNLEHIRKPDSRKEWVKKFVELVNEKRKLHGLKELKFNKDMEKDGKEKMEKRAKGDVSVLKEYVQNNGEDCNTDVRNIYLIFHSISQFLLLNYGDQNIL
ncbi:MAG: hypothetical protein MJ252_04985 [archaeon]|nr:hypothetical protein [archaeon]